MYRERKPLYGDQLRIIGSPEKLERDGNPGSDLTNTRRDLELLDVWGRKSKILSYPATTTFDSKVKIAFHPLFEISHPTFLYYVGHGLDKEKASELHYSASPRLDELMARFVRYRDRPDYDPLFHVLDTLKEKCDGRKVKGGELFLHQFGFCDLYGLLKFWCAGVCDYVNVHDDCYPSLNFGKTWIPEYEKAWFLEDEEPWFLEDEEPWFLEDEEPWVPNLFNSQLVVILDSCYSGEVAQQLHDFVSDIREKVPSPPDGINITIQAACGTDERTFGGYFTPVFTYLNDPENEEVLEKWKDEWKKMTEEARSNYKSLDLPSPMVVTTLPAPEDTTMKFTFQGNFGWKTSVTLFPDAGFFKFCFVKVHRHQDKTLFEGQDRVLDGTEAKILMDNGEFKVFDYKLKTFSGSSGQAARFRGNPVGLFLLEVPSGELKLIICAHIHFAHNNTGYHTRINLVQHHNVPCVTGIYGEDRGKMTPTKIKKGEHKIDVTDHYNAGKLVQNCREFVEKEEPGRWSDVSKWDMAGKDDVSVLGKFKMIQERSAWEDESLKYIEQFNLPKVSDE